MHPLDNPFFLLILCEYDSDRRGEYVCFSSFFLLSIITSIYCIVAVWLLFRRQEKHFMIHLIPFFFSLVLSISPFFSILCSNNSSSFATITTITINYKMIKSSRPMRTASLFPSSFLFFSILSIRRPLVR